MLGGIAFQLGRSFHFIIHAFVSMWRPLNNPLTVAIVFYSILAIEFLTRVVLKKPIHRKVSKVDNGETLVEERKDDIVNSDEEHKRQRRIKLLVLGLGFSTLCLFIR